MKKIWIVLLCFGLFASLTACTAKSALGNNTDITNTLSINGRSSIQSDSLKEESENLVSSVDSAVSINGQSNIQSDSLNEELENRSEIEISESPEKFSDMPATTSENIVIASFYLLWKEKGGQSAISVSEKDVKHLGTVNKDFELYEIIPMNASGEAVMTYQTYQGYTIASGTHYQPSAFALYLFNKNERILYTVEDGAYLVDFSDVYRLLPDNMKK